MNKKLLLLISCLVFGFRIECAAPMHPVAIVDIDSVMLSKLEKSADRKKFFGELKQKHSDHSFLLAACFADGTPEYANFCKVVRFIGLERDIELCCLFHAQSVEIDPFEAIIWKTGMVTIGFRVAVTREQYVRFLAALCDKINDSGSGPLKHKVPDLISRSFSEPAKSAFKPFKK